MKKKIVVDFTETLRNFCIGDNNVRNVCNNVIKKVLKTDDNKCVTNGKTEYKMYFVEDKIKPKLSQRYLKEKANVCNVTLNENDNVAFTIKNNGVYYTLNIEAIPYVEDLLNITRHILFLKGETISKDIKNIYSNF